MAEVKRYTWDEWNRWKKCSDGEAVMFYDHAAIVAALERRARIVERALELLWDGIIDCTLSAEQAKEDAKREIDAELAKEQGK